MFLALITSPTLIIPPTNLVVPIEVYVADYGFHSSLFLPDGYGGLIEYAYGDWHYFALGRQNWSTGLAALFLPTPGTLARRQYSSLSALKQAFRTEEGAVLLHFSVSRAEAVRLLQSLNDRFQQYRDTQIVNSVSEFAFVRVEKKYSLFHNSNHELVAWLRDLDCQVKGFAAWPNFYLTDSKMDRTVEE